MLGKSMSTVTRGNILSVKRVYFGPIMSETNYLRKLVKIENIKRFLDGLEKYTDMYP